MVAYTLMLIRGVCCHYPLIGLTNTIVYHVPTNVGWGALVKCRQLNFAKVSGYLPGNGALLQAVAAMAAGFDSPGR